MKKLFWSNTNYFQPQTHCFKFQLPSNKKFITCANFSNTNIHFYNAEGEAIFTRSQPGFRGFGAHFRGRSQCQKETAVSSMQTTFGRSLLKPLNTRSSCNCLESYYFHISDSTPTRGSSLIWMAILQLRHLYIQIHIPTDSSYQSSPKHNG